MASAIMMSSPYILVTGFGPFRHHIVNPSWEVVKLLPNELIVACEDGPELRVAVVKHLLSVEYSVAADLYQSDFPLNVCQAETLPLLIIHVGVNGKSAVIEFERYAYNRVRGLDVAQQSPADGKVISADALDARLGTDLDLKEVVDHTLRQCDGLPMPLRVLRPVLRPLTAGLSVALLGLNLLPGPRVRVSRDGGRYVCNFVYYHACRWVTSAASASASEPETPASSADASSTGAEKAGAVDSAGRQEVGGGVQGSMLPAWCCATPRGAVAVQPQCVFVHIPPEGKPFSVPKMADILGLAVHKMISMRVEAARGTASAAV